MSVGRISTYALHQSTLRDATRAQNLLAEQQTQISSGNKAQDFAGLGGSEAEQLLSLENKISRSDVYVSNNTLVSARLNVTDNVLSQVIETVSDIKNLISQRRNDSANSSSFDETLDNKWKSLTELLNTSLQGRYLFSGSRTNVPAVDSETFPTLRQPGVPDDGYYQGSQDDVTARIDDYIEMTYNVRADAPAFQKIFAGLATAMQGHETSNDSQLQQAYDFLSQGTSGLIDMQAVVNQNKVAVNNVSDRHASFKVYWQGVKEEIVNTDIVSVSTQVAINQGILQASFQAFAKINSLRLSDFLR